MRPILIQSRSARSAATALAITVISMSHTVAQPADCKAMKDDKERLACYDAGAAEPAMVPVAKPPEDPILAKAKSAVANSLKDPPSARFESVARQGDAVCGYINAKNSYGGYVGKTRFIYVIKTGEGRVEYPVSGINVSTIGEVNATDKLMVRYCSHLKRAS